MQRVGWSVLDGEQVETVLACMLCTEFVHANRIRASKGDGGIDVLTPNSLEPNRLDVLEIKQFSQNLSAGQKKKIESSFRRVLLTFLRRGFPLADWYLVMPLDPTLENLRDWFEPMPDRVIAEMRQDAALALENDEVDRLEEWRAAPGRIIKWRGLDYCDGLAAKYPNVIDYYLADGRERLRVATETVARLGLGVQEIHATNSPLTAPVTPGELQDHLADLLAILDYDPHFRYAVSIDPEKPILRNEPWLVGATQRSLPTGWVTLKIYARYASATEDRPVPVDVAFRFEDPGFDHDAYASWLKYGTPLTVAASVTADLPGGLARSDVGTVRISPSDTVPPKEIRMRIARPDGTAGSPIEMKVFPPSVGPSGTGVWVESIHDSKTFSVDSFHDKETGRHSMRLALHGLVGATAVEVLPVLEFLSEFTEPNCLEIGGKLGPYRSKSPINQQTELVHPAVLSFVRSLVIIQEYTEHPITVPDLSEVTEADWRKIDQAILLLQGKTLVSSWTEAHFEGAPFQYFEQEAHTKVEYTEKLAVDIGGVAVQLGEIEHQLASARLSVAEDGRQRAVPGINDIMHTTLLTT